MWFNLKFLVPKQDTGTGGRHLCGVRRNQQFEMPALLLAALACLVGLAEARPPPGCECIGKEKVRFRTPDPPLSLAYGLWL